MLSEKLARSSTSGRFFLMVLTVGLAIAMAFSIALAGDAEAKKKKKKKKQPGQVALIVKERTVVQSGDNNVPAEGAKINAANTPFELDNPEKFASLQNISITATLTDADTGPGEFAENDLSLALDGIDTGIKLNGYRNNQTDTRTNSGAPANADQILAALKADGKLQASIIDAAPPNSLSVPANFQTTLVLKGKQG